LRRPWALPLVPLYAAGASLRGLGLRIGLERTQKLRSPVISVGSLSAGGAGKTPFVIALAGMLRAKRIDVLSRGYGRSSTAVERVDPGGSPERFGDEPLLIAREAGLPVFVGGRRFEAGLLAESQADGPVLHLLDDGFQHRQLARDVDIVLVSSEDLSDWLLPAGNLREGVGALRRASVLAVPLGDDAAVVRLRAMGLRGLQQPVWRFRRVMDVSEVRGRVLAFCGIARPGQFFSGLEEAGVPPVGQHAFADHHRFSPSDMAMLNRLAGSAGADAFVTTAKDHVRLGALAAQLALPVQVASLRVEIEDAAAAVAWLERALGSA
jgi:tetraacyldisaccharide 4'-kinase